MRFIRESHEGCCLFTYLLLKLMNEWTDNPRLPALVHEVVESPCICLDKSVHKRKSVWVDAQARQYDISELIQVYSLTFIYIKKIWKVW